MSLVGEGRREAPSGEDCVDCHLNLKNNKDIFTTLIEVENAKEGDRDSNSEPHMF